MPALLLAAVLLAACGEDGGEAEQASAPDDAVAVAEPVVVEAPPAEPEPEPAAAEPAPPEPAAAEPAPVEPVPAPAANEPAPAVVAPEPEPVPPPAGGVAEAGSDVIRGQAEAIESAIIIVNGTRVMLYGLESMHPPQICYIDGQPWECWAAAVRQLQTFLGEAPVECTPVGSPDFMGRVLALCEQNGVSLNERYVRSGFALAIETEMPEYAAAEAAAREEGIGLWQGQFVEPREFRESRGITVTRP
jgi:endonuclease YncB( thermonuclease family)